MKQKILILDYHVGNVKSVIKVIKYLGYDVVFSNTSQDLKKADKIILPGQGSFDYAIEEINKLNLKDEIINQVINKKKYLLGICLGMQILASVGYENEKRTYGLDLIPGEVTKFTTKNTKLPHIGWSEVSLKKENSLFDKIPSKTDFYHCHSYIFKSKDRLNIIAESHYSEKFTTAINYNNIYGVQFHPEKSLKFGLQLIKNFLNLE